MIDHHESCASEVKSSKKNSLILDKFSQIRHKPRSRILTPVKLSLQSWTSHESSLRVFLSKHQEKKLWEGLTELHDAFHSLILI